MWRAPRSDIFLFLMIAVASLSYGQDFHYKQYHRDILADVVDGELEVASEKMKKLLADDPCDPESLFMMAIIKGQEGDTQWAMDYVIQSIKQGLPFQRYLAGPRDLLKPVVESSDFQRIKGHDCPVLLHGPMLGSVSHNGAKFWVRTEKEISVRIAVSEKEDMSHAKHSDLQTTRKENDFTGIISIEGLKPNHVYFYQLQIGDRTEPDHWSFRTLPPKGLAARFEVAFGGGAGFTPKYRHMWHTLAARHPLAFLFLGDNVYIDHPEYPDVQDYVYHRRQSMPEYRFFTARTSIFAIWDDHDFGANDSWGTSSRDSPAWKLEVWEKFRNNWINPYYGGGTQDKGVWFDHSIADVDFIMLDGRYYRTAPDETSPEMLGKIQREWLFSRLQASKATFKVIASPVPWSFGSKSGTQMTPDGPRPGAFDTWEGFKDEREEIFSFVEKNRIEGVFLISADRHRSDAWVIERPNGYDLFEFESSKLTNIDTHEVIPQSLFGYNERCSFGLLKFDTTKDDPEVGYEIVNIDNEVIYNLSLKRSQLEF